MLRKVFGKPIDRSLFWQGPTLKTNHCYKILSRQKTKINISQESQRCLKIRMSSSPKYRPADSWVLSHRARKYLGRVPNHDSSKQISKNRCWPKENLLSSGQDACELSSVPDTDRTHHPSIETPICQITIPPPPWPRSSWRSFEKVPLGK